MSKTQMPYREEDTGRAGRLSVCLEQINGTLVRREVRGRFMVGSNELNDMAIDDPTVSRFHFIIVPDRVGERIYLIDMHSTNGTWKNGVRVRAPALLYNGDLIQVGRTNRIRVSCHENTSTG